MRKFHRKRGLRKSFLKVLAHNLIMNGRIKTTEAKAKEIKSFVEKLITIARKQNLASFRLLLSRLSKDSACKLYYDLAPKYKNRHSGQLKIVKMAIQRKRDAAKMAIIEFI